MARAAGWLVSQAVGPRGWPVQAAWWVQAGGRRRGTVTAGPSGAASRRARRRMRAGCGSCRSLGGSGEGGRFGCDRTALLVGAPIGGGRDGLAFGADPVVLG